MKSRYRRMKAVVDAIKDVPCMDCGNKFPSECMDFDHRNPSEKVAKVSLLLTYSLSRVLNEVEKCDIVCANCHRIRTNKRLMVVLD